jgi:hypothetical protein
VLIYDFVGVKGKINIAQKHMGTKGILRLFDRVRYVGGGAWCFFEGGPMAPLSALPQKVASLNGPLKISSSDLH